MPRPTNMKTKTRFGCLYVTSLAKWGKIRKILLKNLVSHRSM